VLNPLAYQFKRIGLEAGPLSQWLFSALAEAGLPVICVETRQASGSLATFTSRTILPASSTMQMLVSLTETSSPAKWSMLRFSF